VFDNARLIALVRAGDRQALDLAYQMTFRTEVGRLVLAHHLMESGVGNAIPIDGTDADLRYLVGQHNAALALAAAAGLDQATIVVAALTGNLEENHHATEQQDAPADVAAYEPPSDDGF
jgi:hypothetical protein